jgi:hypothetical protein
VVRGPQNNTAWRFLFRELIFGNDTPDFLFPTFIFNANSFKSVPQKHIQEGTVWGFCWSLQLNSVWEKELFWEKYA